MKPKEVLLKAFEGGKPDRVPVSLFGGGMWSIRDYGTTFEALAGDAAKMADMLVASSGRLLCDIVYAGSGYNNFHISCLTGSPVKFREVGAPDLVEHVVHAEEDLAKCDIARIDADPTIATVIFNALVIIALIPLALRGVQYRPLGAASVLRRHLWIYGVGGVIIPFPGIKLVDMLLTAIGWV